MTQWYQPNNVPQPPQERPNEFGSGICEGVGGLICIFVIMIAMADLYALSQLAN